MTLVTLTGTISASDLNTNFSDKTDTLLANMKLGADNHQFDLIAIDLTSSTVASLRTLYFTAPDDMKLMALRLSTKSAIGSLAITGTLTCPASSAYLLDQTVSAAATTSAGTKTVANSDFQNSYVMLKKGVTYLLTLSSASASICDLAQLSLIATVYRRYR